MLRYDYHKPETILEAIDLAFRYDGDAVFIAGGTDVMVRIRGKKMAPKALISLRNIKELRHKDKGRIGAGTTHTEIQRDGYIKDHLSALHDGVCNLGSIQIRNVATIGGNICNAAPSADTACPLLVLDAETVVADKDGERRIAIDDFFIGPGETALKKGEILKGFVLPDFDMNTGSAYIKHTRRAAMDLPIVGVAVRITLDRSDMRCKDILCVSEPAFSMLSNENLRCEDVRIAMGVVAPRPVRARQAEATLKGQVISDALLARVSEIAANESSPRDSIRGEAWYRREMVKVLVRRAAMRAIDRVLRPDESSCPERLW